MDDALRDRIGRYVAGEATAEDIDLLREAAADPALADALFEAAELQRDLPAALRGAPKRRRLAPWIAAAAAALVLAALPFVPRRAPEIARFAVAEGDVARLVDGRRETPDLLREGQGAVVGAKGRAVLAFADGSRVELGPDTELAGVEGNRLRLTRGTLEADVVKQPAERPFVVATPAGEARVLGTRLRLVAARGSTRLEVREGKVRLTRADGASVDVGARQVATAAPGIALTAKPAEAVVFRADFEGGRAPKGLDSAGALAAGPEGRACAASRPYGSGYPTVHLVAEGVALRPLPGAYALRFRYFAPAGRELWAQVFSPAARDNFQARVPAFRPGRWEEVEIPFHALRCVKGGAPLGPADAVYSISFAREPADGSFFVDDVEIVDLDPP